jgi:hypothetical protein
MLETSLYTITFTLTPLSAAATSMRSSL